MTEDALENLRKSILEYDSQAAAKWASKAITEHIEPLKILEELTETIRGVGDLFNNGELWLPDLVGASSAMQAATPIIENELKKTGSKRESLGIVVVGTVFGDIHNIGKDMVCTLLIAGGFEVHDLGVNVPAKEFVSAIEKYEADILAMSALLTTTAAEQRKVIQILEERGVRHKVKIMVGGGAITSDFANSIGADGYDPTAPSAVSLAKRLIGK